MCIHVRNLQFLVTVIIKTIHDEDPHFMRGLFVGEDTRYNLRSEFRLILPCVNSSTYGLHSASFRGSQLWNTLPNHFKNLPSVSAFKNKIRDWDGTTYVTDTLDLFFLGGLGRVLLLGQTLAAGEGFSGLGCFLGFQWADLEFRMLL